MRFPDRISRYILRSRTVADLPAGRIRKYRNPDFPEAQPILFRVDPKRIGKRGSFLRFTPLRRCRSFPFEASGFAERSASSHGTSSTPTTWGFCLESAPVAFQQIDDILRIQSEFDRQIIDISAKDYIGIEDRCMILDVSGCQLFKFLMDVLMIFASLLRYEILKCVLPPDLSCVRSGLLLQGLPCFRCFLPRFPS